MNLCRAPRKVLHAIVAAVSILLALAEGTATAQQLQKALHRGREVVAGEVLVKFRWTPRFAPSREEIQLFADTDRDEEIGGLGVRRLHSKSLDVAGLIAALALRGDVEYAEPNYIVHAIATVPNDSYFSVLWGLKNTGQVIGGQTGVAGADIGATLAWDITKGSRANVVAVIDTGFDYTHPDLQANVWSAPSAFNVTIAGQKIACGAGTHGFNAIALTCDPADDNGHGTHVSGTIGALGNNGVGVTGVNWVASVMAAKFLDSTGSGSVADAINAIDFTIQAKQVFGAGANVRVLSNSWGGGGFSQALLDEINKANTSAMLFVAAAGNDGTNNDTVSNYPSNYNAPNVVAVAATDNRDQLASFSNYGATTVDLGAPGVYIGSTYPSNQYVYESGTSMATPHVSGAAALILSVCTLDTAGLRTVILNTVDHVSALAGKTVTGGRLDVFSAIRNCAALPAAPSGLSGAVAGSQVNLTWTDNSTNETGFRIERAVNGGGFAAIGTTLANVTTFTDAGVIAAGTAYSYRVFAYNAAGDSLPSNTWTLPLTITGLTASVPFPTATGTPITWTATTAGGAGQAVDYQFVLINGTTGGYTILGPFSTTNTYVWTPGSTATGWFQMQVYVRSGPTGPWTTWLGSPYFLVNPVGLPVTVSTITSDVTFPSTVGTPVTWTATASGGSAPLEYQFVLINGSTGGYTILNAFQAANTYIWTPTQTGYYQMQVYVRSGSAGPWTAWLGSPYFWVNPAGLPVTVYAITPDVTFPATVGTPVTWTATASGGSATLEYQFVVINGTTGGYAILGPFSATNTYIWTPPQPGYYQMQVYVRSGSTGGWQAWLGSSYFFVQ